MRAPVLLQALAPLIVWAELGVRGRGGEHRGKVPPRGVTLDRARLWPRNLASSPARNLAPNPHPRDPQPRDLHPRDPQPREPYPRDAHPRDLGANPARNLGSSSSRESGSGAPSRESETYPQRNTSTPFIRQSLPPGKAVLRVLNLNFWGLGWPWGSDKEVRIRALREELLRGKYDIVLLQEIWYREDYNIIASAMPFISHYESINLGCTSFLLPLGCSGLTILSRHPITEVRLVPFTHRGSFWRFDGEIFVRKGVEMARIQWEGRTVDVFTTHLVSYTKAEDNRLTRYLQAMETISLIARSDADIAIFGGDLNAQPVNSPHSPYGMCSNLMKDALLGKHPDASFHPAFATFGNAQNTYTHSSPPERIDYLMYRAQNHLNVKVLDFSMPLLMAVTPEGQPVSLSDHEALLATFLVESKPSPRGPSSAEDQPRDFNQTLVRSRERQSQSLPRSKGRDW